MDGLLLRFNMTHLSSVSDLYLQSVVLVAPMSYAYAYRYRRP